MNRSDKIFFSKKIKWYPLLLLILFFTGKVIAQSPQNYPSPVPEPLEFNLKNTIVFIVLPLLLFLAYYLIRRRSSKKRLKEKERK